MDPARSKWRRFWRFFFRLHFYAILSFLGIAILLGSAGYLAWKMPRSRRWIHSELVRLYLEKVAPRLPFTIRDINVDAASWSEFRAGNIARFEAELVWKDWRLALAGPARWHFDHSQKLFTATYSPQALLLPPLESKVPQIAFPLQLAFSAREDLSRLNTLTLSGTVDKVDLAALRLQKLSLNTNWDGKRVLFQSSAKKLVVTIPQKNEEDDAASTEKRLVFRNAGLELHSPLKLLPFRFGPELDFTAKPGPIRGTIHLPQEGEKEISLQWRTKELLLVKLLGGILAFGNPGGFPQLKKLSGSVQSSGTLKLPLPPGPKPLESMEGSARLRLKNIAFEWPENYFALSGLNLDLPVSTKDGLEGTLSIEKILYRRVEGKLLPTRLVAKPSSPERRNFQVLLGGYGENIPLKVAGVPLKIANVEGTLNLQPFRYNLRTAIAVKNTEPVPLLEKLCVKSPRIPPAEISANFPTVTARSGDLNAEGELRANLFGGAFQVGNIKIFHAGSKVPEVDFNFDLDGVRLDQLGDWSGFGEMNGILHAYAHNVVFQSWLPTQFDVLLEAHHLDHPKIVFSPEAMQNLARLVASSSFDHIPSYGKWLAFGWPSRMLLGGFDIWIAGISLFSRKGSILLETLNPQDIPESIRQKQKENHYIVYGKRFSIPLNTVRYPVVVSAQAVSRYFAGALAQLGKLRDKRHLQEKKNEKKKLDCSPPTL